MFVFFESLLAVFVTINNKCLSATVFTFYARLVNSDKITTSQVVTLFDVFVRAESPLSSKKFRHKKLELLGSL